MSGSVIAAVLMAALMHAGWNTLVKAHAGTGAPTILVAVTAAILCACCLKVLQVLIDDSICTNVIRDILARPMMRYQFGR